MSRQAVRCGVLTFADVTRPEDTPLRILGVGAVHPKGTAPRR